jgi:hypothetical protein
MKILAKQNNLYVKVLDDYNRQVYENHCVNKVHYECVKYFLKKLKHNEPIDNSVLKPIKEQVS